MPVDALQDGSGRNLRQFFRLHLMQASAIHAAFREKPAIDNRLSQIDAQARDRVNQ
jgi:hypothetical protein